MKRYLTLIVFCLSCLPSFSQCSEGINQTFAILNFGSGNVYYNLQSSSGNPPFEDANLGSFCPYGTLILEGGQNQVYKCNGADIWQNQIWYRIYPTSASPTGSFTPITEYYQSGYSNGCGGADQTWEANGANINVLSGLSAGTYYLEVYSTADYQYCGSGTLYASNGSYNYRAQFTVNAATASVNNAAVCSGSTATLTATGGTGYVWSTGATTSSITTTTAGTYHVTATTSSGCTTTASGTVSIHPNPSPHAGRDTTVGISSSVVLGDTLPIGGTAPYTFQWTPSVGLSDTTIRRPTATPVVNTNYIVQATDSFGCTGRDTVTVFYNDRYDPLTAITYSARNQMIDTIAGQTYIEFDVFATDTPALLFSQGNIFIQYDSTIFGSNLVTNGKITASKGQSIDSAYYNLSVTDSTSTILKISIAHIANATSLSNLDSLNQQLCHLKIEMSGFNLTTVAAAFDTIAMAGHSEYKRSVSGLDFPYSIVKVSGLVGAPLYAELAYDLNGFSTTLSSGYLAFNVTARSSPPSSYSDGQILIDYDTLAFGSWVATNNNYSYNVISYNDGLTVSDRSASQLVININNLTSQTTFDQLSNTPDSLFTFYFLIQDCNQIAGVSLDSLTGNTDSLVSDYYDSGIPGTVQYYQVDVGYGSDNSLLCLPVNPYVSGISTDCPNAGNFEVFSIYGERFGTDTGTVYFNSANNPGTFIATKPEDIRAWSDNQIDLLIPSDPFGVGVASSGQFYIKTAAGLDNTADNTTISIGYANLNIRGGDNYARFVYLRDTPYIFQLDSFFFNTPDARASIVHIISEFNCYMGLNFQVDTTTQSPVDTASPLDHINLISLRPRSSGYFTDSTVLAFTDFRGRIGNCNNGLSQYNDWADYLIETDITINANPPSGRTWRWGYSFSSNPSATQYDFATVLAHEMGHAAMLCHTQPQTGFNIMYPHVTPAENNLDYGADPDDILGVQHVISLGAVLAVAGCPASETSSYFPGCGNPYTPNCVPRISSNVSGIEPITNQTFNATLYPNPYEGNTVIHIDVSAYTNLTITIYDVVGHLIMQRNVASDISFDLPLSDFNYSNGLYLINISDSHNSKTLKMIKL